jgi:metal-responsive CopG/Arc/MetJ family transcriptional regulator
MKDLKTLKSVTADNKVKISINIPKHLLVKVDEDRNKSKMTRSAWLSLAAMERIKNRIEVK